MLPELHDGTVRLRAFCAEDYEMVIEAATDPAIPAVTTIPIRAEPDEARAWIERQHRRTSDGDGIPLCIAHAADDRAVGFLGLWREPTSPDEASVGYWVVPSARGHGLAKRALSLAAPWALADGGWRRLTLYVDPGNEASRRTAAAGGFTFDVLVPEARSVDGVPTDMERWVRGAPGIRYLNR